MKKITGSGVCIGLLLAITPISIPVQAKEAPKPIKLISLETQEKTEIQKPSKEKIDKKLKIIKKTMKGFTILKYVLTTLSIGSVGVIGLGIGAAVLSTIIANIPGITFGIGTYVNIYAVGAIAGLTSASVALIVGGLASTPQTLDLFGGLSSKLIVESMLFAKQLNKIEKRYPGTLSQKQKNTIAQFKNITHGPILKGIVKGLEIKLATRKQIVDALEEHPAFIATFLGRPQAMSKIKQYINLVLKQNNLLDSIAKQDRKIAAKKRTLSRTKNIIKKVALQAELAQQTFNLTYLIMKKNLKKIEHRLESFNKQYPDFEKKLKGYAENAINNIAQIVEEFKPPA